MLEEGLDYTIEDGLYVFTSRYLLNRGYCCGSNCRNCPYSKTPLVSMVPSWTELLIACGARVVGRTRFCVHPESAKRIPAIGGTKNIDWQKLETLKAQLLILDREENPKAFATESPIPYLATHVKNLGDVAFEIRRIAEALRSHQTDDLAALNLDSVAARWDAASQRAPLAEPKWSSFPGVIEWIRTPTRDTISDKTQFVYLIWKNPWMVASRSTFIGSMLSQVGLKAAAQLPSASLTLYPELDLESLPKDCVLLCSTEPYPFARERESLLALNRPVALIDGEKFSWFGLRSLEFLESLGRAHDPSNDEI